MRKSATFPTARWWPPSGRLVKLLLAESEAGLQLWREKVQAAVGHIGQVVINVIPEVGLIIGPQPPVPELGPQETQNRFRYVFQNFIQVFCRPEHPLAELVTQKILGNPFFVEEFLKSLYLEKLLNFEVINLSGKKMILFYPE